MSHFQLSYPQNPSQRDGIFCKQSVWSWENFSTPLAGSLSNYSASWGEFDRFGSNLRAKSRDFAFHCVDIAGAEKSHLVALLLRHPALSFQRTFYVSRIKLDKWAIRMSREIKILIIFAKNSKILSSKKIPYRNFQHTQGHLCPKKPLYSGF
jgi:hypothetical protein